MHSNNLEDLISSNDEQAIRVYLKNNPKALQEQTSFGVSPLMLTCYYKKPALTKILLEFNDDLDFFEACAVAKFDIVAHKIFQNPEVIHEFSGNGFSALGLASYFGNEEIARYLVLKGAAVNTPSKNNFNVFPIHSAAAGNFTGITKMLLENKANPNVAQQSGITPLHSAAQNGNIEMIIMLLENGANVNIRMEGGKLPADLAKEKGYLEIAEILF